MKQFFKTKNAVLRRRFLVFNDKELTGRPDKFTPSKKMNMKMGNRLTGVFARINDATITIGGKAEFFGEFGSTKKEFSCDEGIGIRQFIKAVKRGFGNDQDMHRRCGCDIAKSQNLIILVNL